MSEVSKIFEPSDKPQGRYVDLKPLTSGGMGMVYKAYDTILDKPIAIKTLIFDHKTESLAARFQQEARLVSKLNHPNIVSILDFGLSKEEEPYMVMDFVDGVSLASLIKEKGKYKGQEITDIAKQICRGMAHAHSKGIVHRDIKPGNILIQNQAAQGENVRIVDFGIAKVDDSEEMSGFRTSGSQVLGSPLFMSPEQVESRKIDHRTDIYSLGCVIYMMAAGHPPFHGDSAMDTMQAHVNEMPVNPCVNDENATLAKNLDKLILKCLEKDPDSRFQSMDEVIETIESLDFSLDKNTNVFDLPHKEESKSGSKVFVASSILLMVCIFGFVLYSMSRLGTNEVGSGSSDVRVPEKKRKVTIEEKFSVAKSRKSAIAKLWIPNDFRSTTDDDLKVFESHLLDVQGVILGETKITNDGLKYLVKCPIEKLDLTATSITDDAAVYISQLKYLNDLNVEDTEFGDEGLGRLTNRLLQSINISNCPNFTDRGALILTKKWPQLKSLDIENCKLTSKGLANLSKLNELTRLNASQVKISKSFVDNLVRVATIEKLSLVGSKISKEDLERIIAIKSLKELDASRTREDYDSWITGVKRRYPHIKNVDLTHAHKSKMPDAEDMPVIIDTFLSK